MQVRSSDWWLAAALGLVALLCACTTSQSAVKQTACANFGFPVYFQSGSDQLTTAAAQAIGEAAVRAKSCPLAGIAITGLGQDDAGLASRRAAAVIKALAANGLTTPPPVVDSASSPAVLPLLRHRVDVSVRFVGQP
jgi:hypothetical protein